MNGVIYKYVFVIMSGYCGAVQYATSVKSA